tara:strand:+ start:1776 stop:2297 length:522 start_codon:yes stop_codon:yes gene_type:complete
MDETNIYIRPLTPDDWKCFRAIRIRAVNMHTGYVLVKPEKTEKQTPEYWKEMLNGRGKQAFGLFDQDRLIGITAVLPWCEDPSGKTGIIAMIFIEPEYRRKGYSNLFYKSCIDFAKNYLVWDKLTIGHRKGNEPSRKGMTKHGFQFKEEEEINWPDDTRDIEYRYELDLKGLR